MGRTRCVWGRRMASSSLLAGTRGSSLWAPRPILRVKTRNTLGPGPRDPQSKSRFWPDHSVDVLESCRYPYPSRNLDSGNLRSWPMDRPVLIAPKACLLSCYLVGWIVDLKGPCILAWKVSCDLRPWHCFSFFHPHYTDEYGLCFPGLSAVLSPRRVGLALVDSTIRKALPRTPWISPEQWQEAGIKGPVGLVSSHFAGLGFFVFWPSCSVAQTEESGSWCLLVPWSEWSPLLHTAVAALVLVLLAHCFQGGGSTITAIDRERTGLLEVGVIWAPKRSGLEDSVGWVDRCHDLLQTKLQ